MTTSCVRSCPILSLPANGSGLRKLSLAQVAHYKAFGFVHLKQFLAEELESLIAEHAAVLQKQYGDPSLPVKTRQWVRTLTDDTPSFQRLAEERFAEIAEQLYGPDIFCAYTRLRTHTQRILLWIIGVSGVGIQRQTGTPATQTGTPIAR